MKNKAKIKEVLIENVKKYPSNIAAAIRLTGRQTGASKNTLTYMYYGSPSRNIVGVRDEIPMFITQTEKGLVINTKSSFTKKETKRTLTLKTELINIPDMTSEDKVAFFDMLFN